MTKNFKRINKEAMDGYDMSMRRIVLVMMMMLIMPKSSSLHPHPPSSPPHSTFPLAPLSSPHSDGFSICYAICAMKFMKFRGTSIYGKALKECITSRNLLVRGDLISVDCRIDANEHLLASTLQWMLIIDPKDKY